MSKHYNILVLMLTAVALLAACKKVRNLQGEGSPDSQIAFYNASDYLKNQLSGGNSFSYLLVDYAATTSLNFDSIPNFNSAGANPGSLYQYPSDQYNSRLPQPWIEYLRLYQGAHTITLTDTGGRYLLHTANVTTVHGVPSTLYFTDSMGVFRNWLLPDTMTPQPATAGIRVMDLSPDAGAVFFTIGPKGATGFPDSLTYGQITSFVPWPDTTATTLNIRFFQVGGDSVTILANAPLTLSPGHGYNVLLCGYFNYESFPDPVSGNFISVAPDLTIQLTQSN